MNSYYICSLSAIPCLDERNYIPVHSYGTDVSFPIEDDCEAFGVNITPYRGASYILVAYPTLELLTVLQLKCKVCEQVAMLNLSQSLCGAMEAKWGIA